MKRYLGISIVVCAVWAQEAVRNPLTTEADRAAGAKTFRSHCAECHGLNGEGGRGPALGTGTFYHGSTDAELLRNISDGIPGTEMPGLFYSPDRVWQVVTYLRSLNRTGAVTGDAAKGKALYASKGCAGCHRVNGEGGRMGPDLSGVGRSRAAEHLRRALVDPDADVRQRYWVVSAKDRSGRPVTGFLMNEDTYTVQFMDERERLVSAEKASLVGYEVTKKSKMPSFKGALTAAEVEDVVSYLVTLKAQGGGY